MSKKMMCFLLLFIVSFFAFNIDVFADYDAKVVKTEPCKLYYDSKGKTATGSCIYKDTSFKAVAYPYWMDVGEKVTVLTSKNSVKAPTSGYGSECKSEFVYISTEYGAKPYYGYVCKDILWDGVITDEMKTEFKNAGFPESYYPQLAILKIAHPTWNFVAINTELDFNIAVNNEDSGNKSLIQKTGSVGDVGYLSTAEGNYNWNTDKYTVYDGSTWYAANYDTVAYYLDPRNFLTDMYIFQFETLAYEQSENHLDIVKALLKGQYISKFADKFVESGASAKVSPVYLAALSKQEVGGTNAGTAVSGESFTYDGIAYQGLYNFYNIGATSGTTPVYRGLVYANGGADGKATSYSRPWNTPEKAIKGGAEFIFSNYLNTGQNTSYFKKWNVVYNYAKKNGLNPSKNYTHQYMQNIQAPSSEAYSTYKSYANLGLLDMGFTFYIPVYSNMPASTSLPKKGSPNNYLKTLTINLDNKGANNVEGFTGDDISYEIHVDGSVNEIKIDATKVNSNATISGLVTQKLNVGENKFDIVVTAQNGNKRTYSLTVIKETKEGAIVKDVSDIISKSDINIDDNYVTGLTLTTSISSIKNKINAVEPSASVIIKRSNTEVTSGNLRTGDLLTITSGEDNKTFTIVIYGDTNGDEKINVLDLLRVQKNILGSTNLTGAYYKASDTSKDGKVTVLDLLKVQKHILGDNLISQK